MLPKGPRKVVEFGVRAEASGAPQVTKTDATTQDKVPKERKESTQAATQTNQTMLNHHVPEVKTKN